MSPRSIASNGFPSKAILQCSAFATSRFYASGVVDGRGKCNAAGRIMELVSVIEIVVWLTVGAVALYGLHCLGRWMEAKGWISSRRTSGSTARPEMPCSSCKQSWIHPRVT